MNRYIDTNEAKVLADDIVKMAPFMATAMKMICEFIEALPSADVAPVIHAHWNFIDEEDGNFYSECSNCKAKFLNFVSNYCPNCPAKMDEKKENEK